MKNTNFYTIFSDNSGLKYYEEYKFCTILLDNSGLKYYEEHRFYYIVG
jgi:hypothetical protein